MCEEKCMQGIWAGYPLTVQLSLSNYICSLLCINSENTKNSLVLLCKYEVLFFAITQWFTHVLNSL